MTSKPTKSEIRLHNGDVLISRGTERDAKVDAAMKTALGELRQRQAERMSAFRRARRAAA